MYKKFIAVKVYRINMVILNYYERRINMLLKFKKFLFLLIIAFLIITLFPKQNYASEYNPSLRLELLSMGKSQLFDKLRKDGLVLPSFFNEHKDIAEDFVYEFTPMLLSGQADASVCTFGNWQTYEMLVNLDLTLRKQGLLRDNLPEKFSFSLKNSTPIEIWIQRYVQYNY